METGRQGRGRKEERDGQSMVCMNERREICREGMDRRTVRGRDGSDGWDAGLDKGWRDGWRADIWRRVYRGIYILHMLKTEPVVDVALALFKHCDNNSSVSITKVC